MRLAEFFTQRDVHCRTGSLEIDAANFEGGNPVHCRTGSLESRASNGIHQKSRSLPHRQLRNVIEELSSEISSSLPHRQLRNHKQP